MTIKTIKDLTTSELLKLLTDNCELFYLPYCDEDERVQHFVFRTMIMDTLRERFEKELKGEFKND